MANTMFSASNNLKYLNLKGKILLVSQPTASYPNYFAGRNCFQHFRLKIANALLDIVDFAWELGTVLATYKHE